MISRACHDDVDVVPGPWTPGPHSNMAMFLQLRTQRPVAPKRSLSASKAYSAQQRRTLRLENACFFLEDHLLAGLGAPWAETNQHLDTCKT